MFVRANNNSGGGGGGISAFYVINSEDGGNYYTVAGIDSNDEPFYVARFYYNANGTKKEDANVKIEMTDGNHYMWKITPYKNGKLLSTNSTTQDLIANTPITFSFPVNASISLVFE